MKRSRLVFNGTTLMLATIRWTGHDLEKINGITKERESHIPSAKKVQIQLHLLAKTSGVFGIFWMYLMRELGPPKNKNSEKPYPATQPGLKFSNALENKLSVYMKL